MKAGLVTGANKGIGPAAPVRSAMMAPHSVKNGAETAVWLAVDASLSETGRFWRDKKEIPCQCLF